MSAKQLAKMVRARIHKERPQLKERQHLGLLEKKKDWLIRARDYKRKVEALRKLREKAALRNPDEYHTAMHNSKTKDGVHIVERKGPQYTPSELKAIKKQDIGYLVMKSQQEQKKIERLQSELPGFSNPANRENKHVIFVEDEKQAEEFDPAEYFDTLPELVGQAHNRPRVDQLQEGSVLTNAESLKISEIEKEHLKQLQELEARLERQEKIKKIVNKLELHKKLMGKGRRKKIVVKDKFGEEDPDKTVFKWKLDRKR